MLNFLIKSEIDISLFQLKLKKRLNNMSDFLNTEQTFLKAFQQEALNQRLGKDLSRNPLSGVKATGCIRNIETDKKEIPFEEQVGYGQDPETCVYTLNLRVGDQTAIVSIEFNYVGGSCGCCDPIMSIYENQLAQSFRSEDWVGHEDELEKLREDEEERVKERISLDCDQYIEKTIGSMSFKTFELV